MTEFIIIGGGPCGFATALLLAKNGVKCSVFEGRPFIPDDIQESYPIGLNQRALQTLKEIDPLLEQKFKDTSLVVDSWQIFGGSRRVAKLDSGVVYSSSRARVNLILHEQAKLNPNITVKFGYRLKSMDLEKSTLEFEVRPKKESETISFKDARVIACDGVYSMVRQAMEKQSKNFKSSIIPWTNEYRVLFAKPGVSKPELDAKVHYIFTGCYSAIVDNKGQQQWTCVMSARDNSPSDERSLLLSKDASPENVQALRRMIERKAPLMSSFFDDEELSNYFARRTYRGAVVECNKLNDGERILLLGDAAHSVLPPTGEGINSALEDALIFSKCVQDNSVTCFETFNRTRFPDVHGLLNYAKYLNEAPVIPGEGGARLMFMIFEGSAISKELFGPPSVARIPYSKITSKWKRKRMILLPLGRLICYPIAFVFWILSSPFKLAEWLFSSRKDKVEPIDHSLKPPIQLQQ